MELTDSKIVLIFGWIYAAMIANSFWEAYVEGRFPWDRRKLGWKLRLGSKFVLPAYHFWLFLVMWPMVLTLPLVIYGWNLRLFEVIMSAYISGLVLEDFVYYIVNPAIKLSEFGPKFVTYHPWIKIGRINIPMMYVGALTVAVGLWFFGWR